MLGNLSSRSERHRRFRRGSTPLSASNGRSRVKP